MSMTGLRILEGALTRMRVAAWQRGRLALRAENLERGERGEVAALFALRREGFVVVARRWRHVRQPGDLDLVAWERDTLCFVEVKTRSGRDGPSAESAVDEEKCRVLRRLARVYLKAVEPPPESVRFDVVAVYPEGCVLYRGVFGW